MSSPSGHTRTRTSIFQIAERFLTSTLLAIVGFAASYAVAQSTTEGAIGGRVADTHGAVIAGATVVVHNNGTNAEKTQTTTSSGYFRVTGLIPAIYLVTITAAGFSGYKPDDVVVEVGRVTEISPEMGVAGTTETVVVSGEAPESIRPRPISLRR